MAVWGPIMGGQYVAILTQSSPAVFESTVDSSLMYEVTEST